MDLKRRARIFWIEKSPFDSAISYCSNQEDIEGQAMRSGIIMLFVLRSYGKTLIEKCFKPGFVFHLIECDIRVVAAFLLGTVGVNAH